MDEHVDYDHLALAVQPDPFPAVNALREQCPVAHTEAHGGFWVLSTFEHVCAAARDTERFSSAQGITIPSHGFPISIPPLELDPPLHKVFRQPLTHRFSKEVMARSEPDVRAVVDEQIDAFISEGRADLAKQLTIPFPAIFAIRLLGLPEEDLDRFVDWAVRILSVQGDQNVVPEVFGYFNELFEQLEGQDRGDIPSIVRNLEVEGRPITNVEFVASMSALFTAGLDTTANAAAYAFELIAADDDLRATLIADPALVPDAVEEMLRFITPLPTLCRTTTQEVEIDGHVIPAGERVALNFMAANRDPAEFAEPDTFDLTRNAKSQVAFGHGIHRCLGQHLARIEMTVMIQQVLARMPDYRLSENEPVERYPGITRGISAMPVVFTAGRKVAQA